MIAGKKIKKKKRKRRHREKCATMKRRSGTWHNRKRAVSIAFPGILLDLCNDGHYKTLNCFSLVSGSLAPAEERHSLRATCERWRSRFFCNNEMRVRDREYDYGKVKGTERRIRRSERGGHWYKNDNDMTDEMNHDEQCNLELLYARWYF